MSIYDRLSGNNQQQMMQQLRQDPIGVARQAGYDVPQQLAGNPQAMFQHLMQTGQIKNPMMQKIMPMIQKLNGR